MGEGVTTGSPGDPVIVPFQISCGACHRCRRGITEACALGARGLDLRLADGRGDEAIGLPEIEVVFEGPL